MAKGAGVERLLPGTWFEWRGSRSRPQAVCWHLHSPCRLWRNKELVVATAINATHSIAVRSRSAWLQWEIFVLGVRFQKMVAGWRPTESQRTSAWSMSTRMHVSWVI